ncbi:hypothetical protein TNCV_2568061 [Trichonephila clavipes]|uniref:Uncharacterized protein n=1 Tax=Trichonephila clavipes TaxID=2585209 RepID=A0A8X7BNS1_TRICX|nr:hypothetical protein TNCV_2568061 [Trichonephila clavipes]
MAVSMYQIRPVIKKNYATGNHDDALFRTGFTIGEMVWFIPQTETRFIYDPMPFDGPGSMAMAPLHYAPCDEQSTILLLQIHLFLETTGLRVSRAMKKGFRIVNGYVWSSGHLCATLSLRRSSRPS